MDWVSVSARLLLAGVFAVAAVAKLMDRVGVRDTMRAFRVPAALVPGAAVALPLAEALLCASLLATPTARVGGVASAALLTVFTGGIVAALRRGERPDCNCFGQATSTPVGRGTLMRNGALIGLGIIIAAVSAPGLPTWLAERSAADLAALGLGALAVASTTVAISSVGAQRRLDLEVERLRTTFRAGLEPGTPAPDVHLTDVSRGTTLSTSRLVDGGRAVLVFLSSDCPACEELMSAVGRWQRTLAGRIPILAIGSGDAEDYRALAERHGLDPILVEVGEEATSAFKVGVTPSAVALGPGAVIDGQTAEGVPSIESLIRRTLRADAV